MTSPYRRRNDSRELEARVSSVETAIDHIVVDLGDIKHTIAAGFQDIHNTMEARSELNRPKIVTWAGWAGVLLLIIGMFGSGYVRDLSKLEAFANSQVTKNEIALASRSQAVEKIKQLDHLQEKVDEIVTRDSKLDVRVTAEITAAKIKLIEIEDELEELWSLREQLYNHKVEDARLDSMHKQRIDGLERKVFGE